ncbi:MerR family transcriptional regulator [Parvibaculaceae bacterium PLY_AMNH_Bact1]|nr:MerR family transcriptional regulator [Parvibaculaceae bacterium PLY_AMNH_Bact1]
MSDLTIGAVAKETGLNTSSIRYYESIGLLPPAPRKSGRRLYDPSVIDRLRIIEAAKALDFTLDEMKLFFEGVSETSPPSKVWRAFADTKLDAIEKQIAHAQSLQRILKMGLTCECLKLSDCMPVGPEPGWNPNCRPV